MADAADIDLDAIRERVAAATDGPWEHEPYGEQNQNGDCSGGYVLDGDGEYVVTDVTNYNGAFIAHARQDVLDLLAEVDRLRAALTDARATVSAEQVAALRARLTDPAWRRESPAAQVEGVLHALDLRAVTP